MGPEVDRRFVVRLESSLKFRGREGTDLRQEYREEDAALVRLRHRGHCTAADVRDRDGHYTKY